MCILFMLTRCVYGVFAGCRASHQQHERSVAWQQTYTDQLGHAQATPRDAQRE